MVKLKGLGKGLDALLSASNISVATTMDDSVNENTLQEIAIDKIKPGKYQPRKTFNEESLQELANSILQNGVIQPVVIRKLGNGYELIAGERRLRACKIAKLNKIPAIIKELTDEEALAVALIENIQRKDLNIIEESCGYKRLIDEFSLTHDELAKITGRSRSHITNILRLLNLSDAVQVMLMAGDIDMGHARALLSLPNDLQLTVAQEVIDKSLTTSQVEKYVTTLLKNEESVNNTKTVAVKRHDPNISKLETQIADKLGMMVNIKHNNQGNGRVTITYSSLDELDNLLNCFS